MSNITSIASSGLAAAQLRLDVSANNIANMNTPGYLAKRVMQEAIPTGGVQSRVESAGAPGVSLEKEIVDQMTATLAFKANILTLRTQQKMMGTLLDMRV